MKREELEALGLSKEQIDGVLNEHHKELTSLQSELDAETGKVKANEDTIAELKKSLEGFSGVDVSALKAQITKLEEDIKGKDAEYAKNIADRDFQDILKEAIASANGKNAKAITALLDVDTLKGSKNQKEDIAAAIKTLTEAEDSKMLFGEPAPNKVGQGNPIGSVNNSGAGLSGVEQAFFDRTGIKL